MWTNFCTIVANILNNRLQNTSILSDMACQDLCTLAECIKRTNLTSNFSEIENFCQIQDEHLAKTEVKNKQSSQYQHLQRMVTQDISIKMFAHTDKKQITANTYTPRKRIFPANCYMTNNSYQETYQALTLFLAIKTSSELQEYTSKQKLQNTVHLYKGLCLSKSRLSDYQDLEEEGTRKNILAKILINTL